MKKNQNMATGSYFDFLAGALSISNVITWNSRNGRQEPADEPKKDTETDDYFGFLADTLSISRVVA